MGCAFTVYILHDLWLTLYVNAEVHREQIIAQRVELRSAHQHRDADKNETSSRLKVKQVSEKSVCDILVQKNQISSLGCRYYIMQGHDTRELWTRGSCSVQNYNLSVCSAVSNMTLGWPDVPFWRSSGKSTQIQITFDDRNTQLF